MSCLQSRIQRKDTAGYTYRNKTLASVALAVLLVATLSIGSSQGIAQASSSSSSNDNNNTDRGGDTKCNESAKTISKDADSHESGNVCEISLARKSPTIRLGEKANELTGNEFKYQQQTSNGSSTDNNNVLAITEFQLLQSEVNPVQKAVLDKGWQVTAIQNHELQESPLMIYMHAQKISDLTSILQDIRNVLQQETKCDCV
jgi:hypothetical protein